MNVGCVVVTYNKVNYLKKCLSAIENQSFPIKKIIVIDNSSTDGTKDYMSLKMQRDSRYHYVRLDSNIGGAGGFNRGLKELVKFKDIDYAWIMDDDTIPSTSALEELVNGFRDLNYKAGFICSNVRWINGDYCKMNVPNVSPKDWNEKISYNLVKVKSASFVSILIPVDCIKKVGFPITEFFIWADDVEYTKRLSRIAPCYFSCKSEVIHEMKTNSSTDIIEDNHRIDRYYYSYRNRIYIAKKEGIKFFIKEIVIDILKIFEILTKSRKYKCKKIWVLIKGMLSGLFFNPSVEMYNEK